MSTTPPNFQPQVADTSQGPQTGTFIPRSDNTNPMAANVHFNGPHAQAFFPPPQPPVYANYAPAYAPMYFPGSVMAPPLLAMPGGVVRVNAGAPPGNYLQSGHPPHWNNGWKIWGPTRAEYMSDMRNRADNRPQDMVPSDPDPWRMYEVQELDGNWTRRNRYTIDSVDIGQVRWYQRPDGTLFAKRLTGG